jgi:RNA polymerase sigma factor (sigma-70 family)
MTEFTDNSLLQLWLSSRDARAFKELARRHSQMVFATCRRILRDTDAAEDVTQECFLALAQHADAPPRSLPAWLHVMAVRRSLNTLRAVGRRRERETKYAEAHQSEQSVVWNELMADVDDAIATLPEEIREAVILHFLEGRDQKEIARELGVSQSTISRRIDMGIEFVRIALRKAAPTVSAGIIAQGLHADAALALPHTLTMSLGKLALAAPGAAPLATTLTIGGSLLVKKVIAIAAGVVVLAGAALYLRPPADVEPQNEPSTRPVQVEAHDPQIPAVETTENPVLENVAAVPAVETPPTAVEVVNLQNSEGTISGRVFDAVTNSPLPGIEVTAQSQLGRPSQEIEKSALTDSLGQYRISELPASPNSTFVVTCKPPIGYRQLIRSKRPMVVFTPAMSVDSVDISLEREVILSGTVVDTDNALVQDAKVLIGGGDEVFVSESTQTDTDGTFIFHGLAPTRGLNAYAQKDSELVSESIPITLPEEGLTDLVLVLGKASTVSGVIVDREGNPLPGYDANASRKPSSSDHWAHVSESNGEGRFEIGGLAAGAYELVAASKAVHIRSSQQKGVTVELAPGQHLTDVQLVYDRMFTISGVVMTAAKEPVADAKVYASSSEFGGGTFATTGDDGSFVITELEDGTYKVTAQAGDKGHAESYGIAAGSEGIEIVMREPHRISGRVIDASSKQPLTEFELTLVSNWDDEPESIRAGSFSKRSDPEGRFEIVEFQTTPSLLAVRASGYATEYSFMDLSGPPYQREVEVPLKAGGELHGFVLNSSGAGIAGAFVFVGPAVTYGDRWATKSADDGSFTLTSFPKVSQRISAYMPGYAIGTMLVDENTDRDEPIRIVLPNGGTVRGTVTFANGTQPVPTTVGIQYDVKHALQDGEVEVQPDGSFAIEHVQPGDAIVYARVNFDADFSERSMLKKNITVIDNGVVTTNFVVLPAAGVLDGMVRFPEGTHPAHVQLNIIVNTQSGSVGKSQVVNTDGRFHLEGLPAGSGTIEINATFQDHVYIKKIVPVEVREGETTSMEIAL